jgi:membrane protein required for colicin V production
MNLFDIILLLILAGFVYYGLFYGLVRTLGTFAGVVAGAFLASRLYLPAFSWVKGFFFGYNNLGKVLVFIILFTLINRLVGFLFYLLDRVLDFISVIPFIKTFNRLGGATLGFLTGSMFLGIILFVASRYTLLASLFGRALTGSELAPFMIKIANVLLPLLPEILIKLKSLI